MPYRNAKRPGWRVILPRPPRWLGYRGRVLLLFGVGWLFLGLNAAADTLTLGVPHETLLTPGMRAALWATSGIMAVSYAWRPPGFSDAPGWLALYVMLVIQVGSYLWAYLDYLLPFGGGGYAQGWYGAAVYGVFLGVVTICSGWPEPTSMTRPRGRRSWN